MPETVVLHVTEDYEALEMNYGKGETIEVPRETADWLENDSPGTFEETNA